MTKRRLAFDILAQPDEVTCGPTCLHAIYQYYGDDISLRQVIKEVKQLRAGGTLAVLLGNHALKRGYNAKIYTYNLNVFDPTWFKDTPKKMIKHLEEQMKFKHRRRTLKFATEAYINFIKSGGVIDYALLDEELIMKYLRRSVPILTGLSATYLYGTPREIPQFNIYDSIKGEPVGHFVVINGYDARTKGAYVADPMTPNPIGESNVYRVSIMRLINSIMLGIVTYDANLLIVEPKGNTIKK